MQKKVVLITGANRGIGYEACRQLADAGFHVILTARNPEAGERATETLRSEGHDVRFLQLDVTDQDSVEQLVASLLKDPGRVDVLVNNAGVYLDQGKTLMEIDVALFQTTIDINLTGAYRVTRAILPMMQAAGYGRIVNVSSAYGAMDAQTATTGSYKISKLALNGMTRILADEVDAATIKINTMTPGWVHTEMGGPKAPRTPQQGADTITWLAQLDADGPSGRFFKDRKEVGW